MSGEELRTVYCGSCHPIVDPSQLPKSVWEETVLPEMAARMGYIYNDYNPFTHGVEENYQLKLKNVYPSTPIIDSIQFEKIKSYILELAPDELPVRSFDPSRNNPLNSFTPRLQSISKEESRNAIIYVDFQEDLNSFAISNVFGDFMFWDGQKNAENSYYSPVISRNIANCEEYITQIGNLNPSEVPVGSMKKLNQNGEEKLIASGLHRPVFTHIEDLNDDGNDEILICEFGHHTGQLSMFRLLNNKYEKEPLLKLPGSIKLEVVDLNQDGKKDIIAIFSQAKEGIYAFIQQDNLSFSQKQLIELGPEYGSSWFDLLDYDHDGDLDIVIANGDNADYSMVLKPYHGVRLFLNDGDGEFKESWFYPIYGATRVIAKDFDQDSDFDFAVLSFFPDFEHSPQEGFVYLENRNEEDFEFEAQTTPLATNGNWLTMDTGDINHDGRLDIVLGNFSFLNGDKLTITKDENELLILENSIK